MINWNQIYPQPASANLVEMVKKVRLLFPVPSKVLPIEEYYRQSMLKWTDYELFPTFETWYSRLPNVSLTDYYELDIGSYNLKELPPDLYVSYAASFLIDDSQVGLGLHPFLASLVVPLSACRQGVIPSLGSSTEYRVSNWNRWHDKINYCTPEQRMVLRDYVLCFADLNPSDEEAYFWFFNTIKGYIDN